MSASNTIVYELEVLKDLVDSVVALDPIDYGNLQVSEPELRKLCCLSIMDMVASFKGLTPQEATYMVMATMAKLLEENTVLHTQSLSAEKAIQEQYLEQFMKSLRG